MFARLLSAAAAAAAFATPAHAQQEPVIAGWAMFENSDNCRAIADFDGGVVLALSLDAAQDRATLFVEAPQLETVENGQAYRFDLTFLTGDTLNTGWGTVTMEGLTQGDIHAVMGAMDGAKFVADFAATEYLALMAGGGVVVSVKLKGQDEMVPALRACAGRVAQ